MSDAASTTVSDELEHWLGGDQSPTAPPPHLLAGGLKLLAGALGERLHADRRQHLVGRAQLVARVDPAVLAAQPLPVEQMSARELGPKRGPCQSLDGAAGAVPFTVRRCRTRPATSS